MRRRGSRPNGTGQEMAAERTAGEVGCRLAGERSYHVRQGLGYGRHRAMQHDFAGGQLHPPSSEGFRAADQRNINRYFDTTAFAVPPAFSLGTVSRIEPQLRIPGINNFDIAIGRNQTFREQRVNLQFRAELFSAFNHTQLGGPNGSVTSPDFGRITSATGTRTIQLGRRLSY